MYECDYYGDDCDYSGERDDDDGEGCEVGGWTGDAPDYRAEADVARELQGLVWVWASALLRTNEREHGKAPWTI